MVKFTHQRSNASSWVFPKITNYIIFCAGLLMLAQVCGEVTLDAPLLDFTLFTGQRYFVLGQSAQVQQGTPSVFHGAIADTALDRRAHVRCGGAKPGCGYSGGGCFSVDTGCLIGMVVGPDSGADQAMLLPSAAIHDVLNQAK